MAIIPPAPPAIACITLSDMLNLLIELLEALLRELQMCQVSNGADDFISCGMKYRVITPRDIRSVLRRSAATVPPLLLGLGLERTPWEGPSEVLEPL